MTDTPPLDQQPLNVEAIFARAEADHAAIAEHATLVGAALDFLATAIVLCEPGAGAAEAWVATFCGGLVAGTAIGLPFAGIASALTLILEKGLDAEFYSWAKARVAANAARGA